ncbi:RpnC/YadD family protein [Methylovulum psychrotolerans]|uniref:Transposase (putative) YhgA-like domain-containing protein n=1 Tax=Methylovulum psychrotolerans TaxID=1704499 RepID=A0A1Z4BYK8_9GAMM|nr:hypothetical protein [Methylovulum psychrotolerans]ASF46341.1 hypothetical protein CEK71_09760 [Methylovulum psychrotolerans]
MGQKDIISKQIFKRILVDVATYIFNLPLAAAELIETEQQRLEDRRADLLARVSDHSGKTFILHIEIQNQNQTDMPDRMLRYLTDIRLCHPGEEVCQYLLYIGKSALAMPGHIQTPQLHYRYTVLDMHEMDYRFFINQNSPDAIVLALLCDLQGTDAKTIIHDIITKLIAITQDDSKRLREYLSMLEILASNRNIHLDIQQEFAMLQIEIEKLPSFILGQKKGIERGIDMGMDMGERNRAIMVAKQLIQRNFSVTEIVEITGLDASELPFIDEER